MRLLRVLATAAIMAALLPVTSSAQADRQFKDAWFWGLKTGAVSYASATTTNGGAPFVGAEWLITRTRGGLYLSFDQAFFNTGGGFVDRDPDSTSAFLRPVRLQNMHRFTMAAMVFPLQTQRYHAYAGLGMQYNAVSNVSVVGPLANPLRAQIAQDSILARKAAFTPVIIAGTQARFRPLSLFAQVTVSPAQKSFFLYNGAARSFNYGLELGMRYNVGSSIDRQRP